MTNIEGLNQEMAAFFRPLWPGQDKPLVFGEGKIDTPRLMLIGEAPGEQEVIKKRPFVGKAGKNLDAFLELAGLERPDIYVSNVVKIRPSETGETGRVRNRAPNKEELALFTPWLFREIEIVNPQLLVTLGNVPLRALMGHQYTIGDVHGTVLTAADGHHLFALYHPASIIYRKALAEVYENDVLILKKMLHAHDN